MRQIPDHLVDDTCERCQCCSYDLVDCYKCGGDGHADEYDESTPRDFEPRCNVCYGSGSLESCRGNCDLEGKHNKD